MINRDQQSTRFLWMATAVLLLAALMRLFMLQGIPLGLARDEVRNAEIVSHILQGEHALFFRAGFGHEPLYHYFGVPFQVLLGENVLSIRLPSVFLGMLLIAAVLRWAKRDFGQTVAVLAGAGLAVGWMPIVFSRIGIRPIMDPLFLVAMAWFWWKRPFWAGVMLGLSFYTYTAARVNFMMPLCFAIYQLLYWLWQHREGSLWVRLQPALIILGTAVIIYLPLQWTLSADPTLQSRVQELGGPLTALRSGDLQPVFVATIQTLGIFSFTGPPRWTYTVEGLSLFNWLTAVFFYIGLFIAIWRIRLPQYALVLIWLAVGLIPSAITPEFPSIIRIIGSLPIIYLLPAIAIVAIGEKLPIKQKTELSSAIIGAFYILALTFFTVQNNFIQWPQNEVTRHKYQTMFYEIGSYSADHSRSAMVIVDDFYEPIEEQSLHLNFADTKEARWVQSSPAAAGALVLPQGERHLLFMPEFATIAPELLQVAGIADTPQYRNEIRPFFTVHQLPENLAIPNNETETTFDQKLTFLGHDLLLQESELELFTFWRVDAPLPSDLALFVHLLDAEGNMISQHDGLDAIVSTLQVHDVIVQRHLLPLTNPLPEDYQLRVGAYLRENGIRLTHDGELSDHILLGEAH